MAFLIELIGYFAGFMTTVALLPQALKSWKSKHTKDVSLGWITILTTGVILWIIYGLLTLTLPLVVANIATLVLCLTVLTLKIKYG
ncbi:SemiSWEET transporter [Candidatus Woesearchaeota archaeon]|nr:SemiSWEET transporter [Candidatus Woesearchaeota archaeon]